MPMQQSKKFRLVFGIWWWLWCELHAYVLYSYFAVLQIAIVDSIVTNLLTAAACLLIYNNMRFYIPKQEKYWYILIVSAVLSAICTGLATVFLHWLYQGNTNYTVLLSASWLIRYCVVFLLIGCMSMLSLLWYALQ